MGWNLTSLLKQVIVPLLYDICKKQVPEDYNLRICITDRNEIVCYQKDIVIEQCTEKEIHSFMAEVDETLKNFIGNGENK